MTRFPHTVSVFLLLLASHLLYGQGSVSLLSVPPRKIPAPEALEKNRSAANYSWAGNMLLVRVGVDTQEMTLLFDTGAPGLVLHESQPLSATASAGSLHGPVETGQMAVRNVVWNTIRWSFVEALSLNLNHLSRYAGQHVDGLLGMELLKGLVFYFHPQTNTFQTLSQNQFNKQFSALAHRQIKLKYAAHLPLLPLEINGTTRWFILDTGASNSLIDRQLLSDINLEAASSPSDRVTIEALNQVSTQLYPVQIGEIALGGSPLPPTPFLAGDMDAIKNLESPESIAGIIGMDVLRTLHCALNLKNNSLLLY